MATISAIFENGVFRPVGDVNLQEGARVRIMISDAEADAASEQAMGYPAGFFEEFAGCLSHEEMERPSQPPYELSNARQ